MEGSGAGGAVSDIGLWRQLLQPRQASYTSSIEACMPPSTTIAIVKSRI